MPRPEHAARVPRFTRAERVTHWVNAVLFTIAMTTGAMFRFGIGQSIFSDRAILRGIHVYFGLAIVVAFLVAVIPRWGRALRRDASRINRWSPDEVRWLKSRGRARGVRLGKFNPGQKLNAAFVPAAALVLAASGSIMFWNQPFSTSLRSGADFVHQCFAWLIWITVAGHIILALQDRESLRGMTGGTVSAEWAEQHRPAWYAEVTSVTPEALDQVDA